MTTTEIETERGLRVAAEDNARRILAAMREQNAGMEAEIANRVAEVRGEVETAIRAELEEQWPSRPEHVDGLRSENARLRRQIVLYEVMGAAGAHGNRLDTLYDLFASDFDFLDDDTPVVRATGDPDVTAHIRGPIYERYPEFFLPPPKVAVRMHGRLYNADAPWPTT